MSLSTSMIGITSALVFSLTSWSARAAPLTTVDMMESSSAGGDPAVNYGVEKGFFSAEGIQIHFIKPTNPANRGAEGSARAVAEGEGRFGKSEAFSVARLASAGSPLKVIATLLQSNPLAMVYLAGKGWSCPKALKGKKLGMMEGSTTLKLLPAFLLAIGLTMDDVTIVITPSGGQASALVEGKVDAIGSLTSAIPRLQGMTDKHVGVFTFGDHGLPVPGDVLYVNTKYLEKKEDRSLNCRIFRAYTRSWDAAGNDPDGAIDALFKANPGVDFGTKDFAKQSWLETYKRSRLRVTLKKPTGYTFPEDWERTVELLAKSKLLSASKPATDYYTNDYAACDPSS